LLSFYSIKRFQGWRSWQSRKVRLT
jgi:hypothetical protein